MATLELQTKQAVGERQGAWEAHYANSEIMLRSLSQNLLNRNFKIKIVNFDD